MCRMDIIPIFPRQHNGIRNGVVRCEQTFSNLSSRTVLDVKPGYNCLLRNEDSFQWTCVSDDV